MKQLWLFVCYILPVLDNPCQKKSNENYEYNIFLPFHSIVFFSSYYTISFGCRIVIGLWLNNIYFDSNRVHCAAVTQCITFPFRMCQNDGSVWISKSEPRLRHFFRIDTYIEWNVPRNGTTEYNAARQPSIICSLFPSFSHRIILIKLN